MASTNVASAAEPVEDPGPALVFIGVDTHRDFHVAVALGLQGAILGEMHLPAQTAGYEALLDWALELADGRPGSLVFGIEGTGCYGAGLSRHLQAADCLVREVNRPNRQTRRQRGKDDAIDAEAAARSLLAGTATAVAKTGNAEAEMLRILKSTRDSAVRCRTRAITQLKALLIVVPAQLRETLQHLDTPKVVRRCLHLNDEVATSPLTAACLAMRSLAERIRHLEQEFAVLGRELDRITKAVAPGLRAAQGIGPDNAAALLIAAGDNPERLRSEAAFAALCGASPIPASSGTRQRHRLNRGGNRQANCALFRIALNRLRWDPATKAYADRRTSEGKSKREILRCLKRFIAREVYRLLQAQSLRPAASGA
jgi:transposase